jgi:hypothetical protein
MAKARLDEIQALRRDGAVSHYAFSTEAQFKRICDDLAGFYFGREQPAKGKEELEEKDLRDGT